MNKLSGLFFILSSFFSISSFSGVIVKATILDDASTNKRVVLLGEVHNDLPDLISEQQGTLFAEIEQLIKKEVPIHFMVEGSDDKKSSFSKTRSFLNEHHFMVGKDLRSIFSELSLEIENNADLPSFNSIKEHIMSPIILLKNKNLVSIEKNLKKTENIVNEYLNNLEEIFEHSLGNEAGAKNKAISSFNKDDILDFLEAAHNEYIAHYSYEEHLGSLDIFDLQTINSAVSLAKDKTLIFYGGLSHVERVEEALSMLGFKMVSSFHHRDYKDAISSLEKELMDIIQPSGLKGFSVLDLETLSNELLSKKDEIASKYLPAVFLNRKDLMKIFTHIN